MKGVFCLGKIQKMPTPMGFAVFLFTFFFKVFIYISDGLCSVVFTASSSFDIDNENHISVLNVITKYDMAVASCVGHVILKSCDRI